MAGRVLHVEGYEGKYVAIDLITDEIVASAYDPRLLDAIVRERGLKNVMTVGVPEVDETPTDAKIAPPT